MKKIKSALISVFDKDGIEPIVRAMKDCGITIYSTGGTQKFIEDLDVPVQAVESLTSYPSILGGRVKTLHPKVFGGILARREEGHLQELTQYEIPEIDCVVVDLYPFEKTVASTSDESQIIEKIDIGGIALIRAAAKNYGDVLVVPSKLAYSELLSILTDQDGATTVETRKKFAAKAFAESSNYDTAIFNYFNQSNDLQVFRSSHSESKTLRYGENPHQQATYFGDLNGLWEKHNGKALSYNNLVDVDAAMNLMYEFKNANPTFAILKHTNACGVATRETISQAWDDALAGDSISAFGGILISNSEIDLETAQKIDKIFYEVLLAPNFSSDALSLLSKKEKRILLQYNDYKPSKDIHKTLLNGVIQQDADAKMEGEGDFKLATKLAPTSDQVRDLIFANKCAKHLKSNTIALVKNEQLVGMGCGQTSRVDALKQAIIKAKHFELSLEGSVMASDAFFPFPDCVEIAAEAGVKAVVQPGGSIRDKDSIEYCDNNNLAMVLTGNRHFKH